MSEQCPFCSTEINSHRYQALANYFPPNFINHEVLYQNNNFVVYPELHPAAKGIATVLLVPKEHLTSYQDLPTSLIPDFIEAKSEVERRLGNTGKPITWFEHGSGRLRPEAGSETTHVGKSIFHAHLHGTMDSSNLYPFLKRSVLKTFEGQNVETREIRLDKPIPELLAQLALGLPYLYLGEGDNEGIVVVEKGDVKVPSQFLRREIANAKEQKFIDWKNMETESLEEMAGRLHYALTMWNLCDWLNDVAN